MESIPPTQDALLQHTKRAAYQSQTWCTSDEPFQDITSPEGIGRTKEEDTWQPVWITLPVSSKACLELVNCECKKGCTARCSCRRANWKCTALCSCNCAHK
uniref:Tesmin/TSO1-like CXC domain-containing protein n=1 Tax=Amphimedon queenslandica TaxID=400682 RepID=A0A1X7U406_AMPQE